MTQAAVLRMILLSRLCAGVAGFFAALTLVGYALKLPGLIALHTGLQAMSPITAAGILLLATAAIADSFRQSRLLIVAAALAAVLGAAALISHALTGADVISSWLGVVLIGPMPVPLGRTSIATAAALLLIAAALTLRRRASFAADITAGAALLIAGIALLGYLYDVGDLYALPMFNTMALHTAGALVLLSCAALTVEPRLGWASLIGSDDIGGDATRRQLAFVALPIIAGWLLLRATEARNMGPGVAMALLVICTIVPLALLVLRDGHVLNALDRARAEKARIYEDMAREMVERLGRQAKELAQEAAERAKAEEAMYRAQRMEAIGQLTGGIAHDFNNLLMAVHGNLELLKVKLPSGSDPLQRYIANAMTAADRGARITSQLLAFSRSQRLNIRATRIDPVLITARDLIGHLLGINVKLTLDLQADGVWATTDPDQLELAILNLAVNARDAMPDGGHITIESRTGFELLADDRRETECVIVRMTDDGVGMLPGIVEKATEPFFTTKAMGEGTGLGLAQVYGFSRQCGGDLRIVSKPGVGTTVEMLFRRAEAIDENLAARTYTHRNVVPAAGGRQIVVIDDDDTVRAVLVDALATAGFEVLEASDGESGLALLRDNEPSAAVIDFLMPGMNGAEVARRAQANRPGLPIIFVSGYADTLALDGIADAIVLRKPFDLDGLNHALHSVLH